MARGINKVILVGNVGTEPEIRYMPNGNPVANISIATSESWKDKQTGEKQERTEWHRGVCYNRLAEIVGEYVRKGSKVYAEGSLRTRKWQDQSGNDKYTTEIIINELQMLDSRAQNSNQNFQQAAPVQDFQQAAPQQAAPQQNFQQAAAPQQSFQQAAPAAASSAIQQPQESFDDDIPF